MKKTTDIILNYKDTVSVIKDIKDFINNDYSGVTGSPIVDPLDDASLTRGSGTGLAAYDDDVLQANFPKITFDTVDLPRDRVAGGKSVYRERFRHNIIIKYTCNKQHTWTYNATSYKGGQQCIRYLQYLGDQLKKYSGSFEEFNEMVIGAVSNPVQSEDPHNFTAFLPIKVDTHGRTGS